LFADLWLHMTRINESFEGRIASLLFLVLHQCLFYELKAVLDFGRSSVATLAIEV
jgi:hypothetical protein